MKSAAPEQPSPANGRPLHSLADTLLSIRAGGSWRASLFLLAGLMLWACQPPRDLRPGPDKHPRGVILIVIDTLRADHVGAYGSTLGLTPNLDAMASRGVIFENAIAPSSWTRSTVASLFTSRYPSSVGVLGRDDALPLEITTLPDLLRRAGQFQTIGVTTNSNAGAAFGFSRGFDRFETPELSKGYEGNPEVHTAESVTRRALELLDARSQSGPFFLFLHYVDPHEPYISRPGILEWDEPPGRFDGSQHDLTMMDATRPVELDAADRHRIRYLYAGEVKYCDYWIGALLAGLEERGLRDDVLLLITSDHGEGLWDHGVRDHGRDLFQEQIHVPLIIESPTILRDDFPRAISAPVSLVDVAPTILSQVGLPPVETFHGRDLLAFYRGEPSNQKHRAIYSELEIDGLSLEALIHGDYKITRDRHRFLESTSFALYDLKGDPEERYDVATSLAADFSRMRRALDHKVSEIRKDAVEAPRVSESQLDAETLANLEALGYLRRRARTPTILSPRDWNSPILTQGGGPRRKFIYGFYEPEGLVRWMSDAASVVLAREGEESRWQLDGWIDLALHDGEAVTLYARANERIVTSTRIESSGLFTLSGKLPRATGDTVRLDFECDRALVPARRGLSEDLRRLCVVIRSVALY